MSEQNSPGTPAAGGLKDAPPQSSEEQAFTAIAMEQLDADDSDLESAVTALAEQPPSASSPGVDAALSPNPAETTPVQLQPGQTVPPVTVPPANVPQQGQPTQAGQQTPLQQPEVVVPGSAPAPNVPPQQPGAQGSPEDGFTALAQQFDQNREKIIDLVAEHTYKLSDKEVEQVLSEPDKAIPKLLARAHVNAVSGVLQHVAQQIPNVVHGLMQAQSRFADLENKFYAQWPQLDRTKHNDQIVQLTRAYRQLNPEASFEEVSKVVGSQAVVLLNLQNAQRPAVPARPSMQVPFSPAGAVAGGTVLPNGQPKPQSQVELWSQLLDADEAGQFDG